MKISVIRSREGKVTVHQGGKLLWESARGRRRVREATYLSPEEEERLYGWMADDDPGESVGPFKSQEELDKFLRGEPYDVNK